MIPDGDVKEAPPHPSLAMVVLRAARRASEGWLVALVCLGVAGLLVLVWFAPARWPLMFPLVAAGAFGLWGIATHELEARGPVLDSPSRSQTTLWVVRVAAAVVGVLAGVASLFAVFLLLLGDSWSH